MRRFLVLVGTWVAVACVTGAGFATDPKKPVNQPVTPQPVPTTASGGVRYVAPPYNNVKALDASRRAAQQQAAAAAAARNAAAARSAAARTAAARNAANSSQNAGNPPGYYQNSAYGYGYSGYYSPYRYSRYSYSPYGYPYSPYGYIPPGTTPYALGYDPLTGQAFYYPNGGYSTNYSEYGNPYPYYRNPYLGYGYPAAVFVPAGQLYGIGPILQLMGIQ